VLKIKLKHLDDWTARRQANAAHYFELFAKLDLPVEVPTIAPYQTRHVFNQFTLQCERRDELKKHLSEHGVGAEIYYPLPLHLQQCFSELGYEAGDLPVSENLANRALSIPVYPELTREDQAYVVDTIADFYKASK